MTTASAETGVSPRKFLTGVKNLRESAIIQQAFRYNRAMEWLVVGAKALGGIALLVAWVWLGWRLMASTVINGVTFSDDDMESSTTFVAKAGDDFLQEPDTLWDLFKQQCPFLEFVLDNYWGPSAILVAMGKDSVELGRVVRARCSPSPEWIEILRERNPEFIEAVFGPAPPDMAQ